jgi:hypothetical protein
MEPQSPIPPILKSKSPKRANEEGGGTRTYPLAIPEWVGTLTNGGSPRSEAEGGGDRRNGSQ